MARIADLTPSISDSGLEPALEQLGLFGPRPVLILVGAAGSLPETLAHHLLPIFIQVVSAFDILDPIAIDGGTRVGVMALMGRARHHSRARFPLLGIAPRGALTGLPIDASDAHSTTPPSRPDHHQDARLPSGLRSAKAQLDPHHTHFLLTPGTRWGDESPWIAATATHLCGNRASLMLVVGGGEITRLDILYRLRLRAPILLLAGSGGTADDLAKWRLGHRQIPEWSEVEGQRALVEVLDLAVAAERLPGLIARKLSA